MGSPLRYIIVGTGNMGGTWCASTLPRLRAMGKAEPAAAVDVNPEALINPQRHLGLSPEKCYTDLRRAFDENPADFAIVVTPPAHHEAVVNEALDRGMHVLSEKPIADSMQACCRILARVRECGKKMAVTMSHRYDQDKQGLERLVRGGEHGPVDYIVGRNTWTYRSRDYLPWGPGMRYEIADPMLVEGTVHHFDVIRGLAGADAARVHAVTWNPGWSQFKGDVQALLVIEMCNGVKVVYEGAGANATCLNDWQRDYWRVECENATLELDQRKLRVMTELKDFRRTTVDLPLPYQEVWMNPWLAEQFCDWLSGGPAPSNNLDDNIQTAALLFAAIESAHSGKIVDVQDFLKDHLSAVESKLGA